MRQLKDLAIMMMYIYIFMIAISEKNFTAILIMFILCINYIYSNEKIYSFKKLLIKKINNQKDNFINILNHDLRIPIIAQVRALELLSKEKTGKLNHFQKDLISQTEQSCRYILNLTSLIINTYKIENNSFKLIYEKFNISDIIISCFDELLPTASEKNITFEYDSNNKDIFIVADKIELKRVLLNLLVTQITYACKGDKLSVILFAEGNKIRLTITTDNLGCEYADKDTPYTEVGHTIRMGYCKKIIENHHGKIVEDTPKNSFSFEIPLFGAA